MDVKLFALQLNLFLIFKMDYGFSEKRNKRKDKAKNRKKFPYRHGGGKRSVETEGR